MIRTALAFLLCTTSAWAQHIRVEPYSENTVVTLDAQLHRSFAIDLGNAVKGIKYFYFGKASNDILDIPHGKNDKGQDVLPPAVHVLPVTPTEVGTTNLIIVTELPDSYTERTYVFLVTVHPEDDKTFIDKAIYDLRFTYSPAMLAVGNPQVQQVAQVQAISWKEKKAQADREKAEARARMEPFYGVRNWLYDAIGDASIAPVKNGTSDNGNFTTFRYPGNTELPTIYIAEGGAWCEGPGHPPPKSWLRSAERVAPVGGLKTNDLLVVHEVAQHFRLRLGPKVVDISNCNFDPVGQPYNPDVAREVTSR